MESIKTDPPVVEIHPLGLEKDRNLTARANGARNRTPRAVEALLESAAEAITHKLIDRALDGDMTALRLCVERLAPPRRDCPVTFDLPHIGSAADALKASTAVVAACANAVLSPGDAGIIMQLIATHVRTLEVTKIEERLSALETEKWRKP
jgi:hypothetical protein